MVVDSLDAAIADCTLVIGTSTRSRRIPWPLLTARELGPHIRGESTQRPIAVLFGRETSGLTNDELQRCNVHLQIPANPAYPSLNVAMAVQVVCYELYQSHARTGRPRRAPRRGTASRRRSPPSTRLLEHFEEVLTRVDFLDPSNPGQVMARLRRLFTRLRPDDTEVAILRGALTEIERSLNRTDTGPK